jgi:hypothetical protein
MLAESAMYQIMEEERNRLMGNIKLLGIEGI